MGLFDDIEQKYGGQSQGGGLFDDIIAKHQPQEVNAEGKGNRTDYVPKSPLASYGAGIVDVGTFGFDPQIAGAINYLKGGSYAEGRDAHRAEKRLYAEDNPNAYLGGQITSGVATAFAPGVNAVKGATMGAKMARAAIGGALENGLYGAGSTDGGLVDRAMGAVEGAGIGAVTGAAGPLVGTAIGKTFGRPLAKAVEDALPDKLENPVEYAQAAKNKIYQEFKDNEVVLKRPEADGFWEGMANRMKSAKANPVSHAETLATINAFKNSDEAVSLQFLDELRGELGGIMAKGGKDGDMAKQARKQIDKVMDNLQEDNVISLTGKGPGEMTRMIKDAREANTRFRNAEMIAQTIEKAKAASVENGNLEGALRSRFAAIYTNPKKMRFLSESEKAVVERLAMEPTSRAKSKWINDITQRWSFGRFDTPAEAVGGAIGGYLGAHVPVAPPWVTGAVGAGIGAGIARNMTKASSKGSAKQRLAEELLQGAARGGSALMPKAPKAPIPRDPGYAPHAFSTVGVMIDPLTHQLIDLSDYIPQDRLPAPSSFPPGGIRG